MKILYLPHQYSQQRQREKKRWIYPVILAMEAQYYRERGHEVAWDEPPEQFWGGGTTTYDRIITEPEGIPFLDLPPPDRVWTNAKDKRYQGNGNFKYRPGTYIMSANSCWWGRCKFCVEKKVGYNQARPVADIIEELKVCNDLGYKEIFDDSGTFPTGVWLIDFCRQKRLYGLEKLPFSCNMRFQTEVDYAMLKRAGFRMLLYGLESANQQTLDRLEKGIEVKYVEAELREATRRGLDPHVAVMFGYPWESEEEELRTLKFVHRLLRKGYAKTAQASLYSVSDEKAINRGTVQRIYEVGFSPEFWFNKLLGLHSFDDITYLLRGIKEGLICLSE